MKLDRLTQQMSDKIKVVQMPQFDESPILKSRRRMAEFNVENGMKNLRIIVSDEDNRQLKMIKPLARIMVGQWCVNQKVV